MYPLYATLYKYLLGREKGRRWLYLHARYLWVARRLSYYVVERLYLKSLAGYTRPGYSETEGFLYDLKQRLAGGNAKRGMYEQNYRRALERVGNVLDKVGDSHGCVLIDYGCGAGLLTEELANRYGSRVLGVYGLEIRPETLRYNTELRPDINWSPAAALERIISQYGREHCILILNGVVNFLELSALQDLLELKTQYIVWFYQTCENGVELPDKPLVITQEHPGYTHYNVPRLLEEKGYTYDFSYMPHPAAPGGFISGVSFYAG